MATLFISDSLRKSKEVRSPPPCLFIYFVEREVNPKGKLILPEAQKTRATEMSPVCFLVSNVTVFL